MVKTRKQKQQTAPRAASAAASWADPDVRTARTTRNGCRVGRQDYPSVRAAFEALGLPLAKHIRFRAELKAKGRATFEGRRFTLTD